jgi:hypothetical protein
MRYRYAITTYCDVLTQLLYTLLEYKIQHTTYLSSRGVISCFLRSVSLLLDPLTTQTAHEPLGATPRTNYATLSHTCWQVGFVWKSAPPVTFHAPWFPRGPVDTHSSPYTCFTVTTTGLISDRYLAIVSRLV